MVGAGAGGEEGVCSLANYSVAHEETQSNRVSELCDFVCSLFPRAIHFDFYVTNQSQKLHVCKNITQQAQNVETTSFEPSLPMLVLHFILIASNTT